MSPSLLLLLLFPIRRWARRDLMVASTTNKTIHASPETARSLSFPGCSLNTRMDRRTLRTCSSHDYETTVNSGNQRSMWTSQEVESVNERHSDVHCRSSLLLNLKFVPRGMLLDSHPSKLCTCVFALKLGIY